ncbi:MAG TPA: serine/threonine-protein kinase [Gemmata sp.]|jgi:serine/threonine-protein kinase|nr:serine/threonine-protein kinase [Gemmata sp.]
MSDFSVPTLIRTPPEAPSVADVRHTSSATDETIVRDKPVASQPVVSSGSTGFAEEMRLLLRKRLLITHGAIGCAMGAITFLGLIGGAAMPSEAGLGRWAIGLPLLAFGQSVAGLTFLLRQRDASFSTFRLVEVSQFAMIAVAGGIGRFVVLNSIPPESPDPRYSELLYRFDAIITNYPIVFSIILYGVVIPNTRRRSLIGVGLLFLVPIIATALAAATNPEVRPSLPQILPGSAVPLFMAGVIAVFSAARSNALQRQVFDAKREAQQLGAYTLRKKLGEGGMGEVWLAEHRLLKRPCAVKFIRVELAAESATAARFEREVRAVTTLTHFNTVRIYDYGRSDDGSFYYVMEYLNGPTLDQLVNEHGPLTPGRAVFLLRQLCGALAEAHASGMVHRDLKPGNILVAALGGQKDVAKLLDFGLVQDHSATASDRITRAGTVLGTPSYMCPEQAAGEPVDPRGDVYSLGAVAFFVLAGRPPFEGSSVGKLLTAHLTQTAPVVSTLRQDVPADLAAVVARCLAKDPNERFQTAPELDAALAACACSRDWNASLAMQWWASEITATPTRATEGTEKMIHS